MSLHTIKNYQYVAVQEETQRIKSKQDTFLAQFVSNCPKKIVKTRTTLELILIGVEEMLMNRCTVNNNGNGIGGVMPPHSGSGLHAENTTPTPNAAP